MARNEPSTKQRRRPPKWRPRAWTSLINGVLVAVAGLYLATSSVTVTVVGVVAAVVIVAFASKAE
jgi:hypothetical protein